MTARVAAAAALGLGLVSAAPADAPKGAGASVREAIYFGPAGPVRLRFRVSVDGRPADAAWQGAVDGLFAHCDRNGDEVLDPAERAAFTTPAPKGRDIDIFSTEGRPPPQSLRLNFNPKDEKVSRAGFAEALRAAGQAPISFRVVAGRAESRRLSAALFRHLDGNGDGRLSADELKAGRERLAGLDADEDEFVTAAELLGRMAPNPGRVRPVLPGVRQPEEPAEATPDLLFLTADGPAAVKQLLAARGGMRATSLRPAEFGADPKAFAALDQDGNKVLDTTELAAWLGRPPELDLTVSFDSAGGRVAVTPPAAGDVAALPGGRFRFEPPPAAPAKEWRDAADRLRGQFKELAKDAGSVERKQLDGPAAHALFDVADRNGDGKVEPAEVEAALKALAPLAGCRVDVAFADRGDGLFELLDRDDDGRLSPRELVAAAGGLRSFAGPDGSVGPKDLVRRFDVRVSADPIPVGVLVPPPRPAPAAAAEVPAWFSKADRNGDGEVSLREFLGPIELFRKLDRDGDGLLSPSEAAEVRP